ncbi:MAG TPA: hypothetical protein VFH33_01630, partial [Candidatus Krumholzibacteria bacterium]|nr:hypothetical protein [Candidatus Krumholzibacteria bacterium]
MLFIRKLVLVVVVVLTLGVSTAHADSPYDLNRSEEWVWMGLGVSMCAGGFFAAHKVDPLTPAQIQALDVTSINSFDRGTMNPYRDDHAGDAMAFSSFLIPLAFLGNDDMREDVETLGAMWG